MIIFRMLHVYIYQGYLKTRANLFAKFFVCVAMGAATSVYAQDLDSVAIMDIAEEEANKIEQSGMLSEDLLLNEYLTALGQRLVPRNAPSDLRFSFKVIEDPTLNAFALPNGAIFVHSGILARLQNEAQLAIILGHEIGHVVKGHSLKGMKQGKMMRGFRKVIGAVTGGSDQTSIPTVELSEEQQEILDYGGKYAVLVSTNGYSRKLENEADKLGIQYMFEAGFDPKEAAKPFELLLRTYGDESQYDNFFYGNHSRNQDRIKNINKILKKDYQGKLDNENLAVNSVEFQRRTRRMVRENAMMDYELKRYKLAQDGLQRALELGPNDYLGHYYLGNIYREAVRSPDSIAKAIAEYEISAELNEDYAPVRRELGLAQYRKGDYKAAIVAFEKYLELEPWASDREHIERYIEELETY